MAEKKRLQLKSMREALLLGVVLALCVVWAALNPNFIKLNNVINILRQSSFTAIAAVGMTMILLIGEIRSV